MRKIIFLGLISILSLAPSYAQINKIDSLLTVVQNGEEDTNKVYNLLILSDLYYNENFDTAYFYVQKANELAQKLKYPKFISLAYGELAWYVFEKGDFKNAQKYYLKAFKMDYEAGDKIGSSRHLANLGIMFKKQGLYSKSLDCYFFTLKIAEEFNHKRFLSTINGNIGNIYSALEDHDNALIYHTKALEIDLKQDHKKGVARHYGNIGVVYRNKLKYDKALEYFFKALELDKSLGYNNGVSLHLSNIGNVYGDLKEYDKAIEFYFKALAIDEKSNYEYGIAFNLSSISGVYLHTNQLDKLEEMNDKAFEIANRINSTYLLKTIHDVYASFYEKKRMFPEAFEHYKQFITLRDSLQSEENVKASMQKELQYKFEKKESLTKVEREKKEAITTEKLRQQKIIIYSVIGGLILLIITIVFIFKSFLDKKKSNIQLQTKNDEIVHQKELVDEKNKEITDSIQYAKRIQNAILPPAKLVKEYLQESFILYKPKDIVAGDFYRMEHKEGRVLFAAADCTGHGVPGAMVSVVCNNGLNRSVREYGLTDPGEILNKTREIVIAEFEKSEDEVKDGMDIALCSLEGSTLKYAGANNPLWIIRNNEIIETKATNNP